MSVAVLGEDCAFNIGQFGDLRLNRVGSRLFRSIFEKMTVCIKQLAGDRATEVAFGRFLGNPRVNSKEINREFSKKTNNACTGKSHVLCIQDTVQLTYPSQDTKKSDFGPTGNPDTKGLFVHPGLVVDASNRDILGISSIITWCRSQDKNDKRHDRPIEEKESIRWIDTALTAKERLTHANTITIVGDRESDIFEIYDRVPDKHTHIIVRASHDRILANKETISERLSRSSVAGKHRIELPAITGKRKKRTACLEVKFCTINLTGDAGKELILNVVSAYEVSTVPKGESPISWVLITTHSISSLEDAINILTWYTWRWIIEQVFRVMKKRGLRIEDSQIESPEKLQVLSLLCIGAAVRVMSLVEARGGASNQKAIDIFSEEEISVLALIGIKMEGKTDLQRNPYERGGLAWVSWIIARLGGWKGYPSESPPGPVTMLKGLQRFEMQLEGWKLCQ